MPARSRQKYDRAALKDDFMRSEFTAVRPWVRARAGQAGYPDAVQTFMTGWRDEKERRCSAAAGEAYRARRELYADDLARATFHTAIIYRELTARVARCIRGGRLVDGEVLRQAEIASRMASRNAAFVPANPDRAAPPLVVRMRAGLRTSLAVLPRNHTPGPGELIERVPVEPQPQHRLLGAAYDRPDR